MWSPASAIAWVYHQFSFIFPSKAIFQNVSPPQKPNIISPASHYGHCILFDPEDETTEQQFFWPLSPSAWSFSSTYILSAFLPFLVKEGFLLLFKVLFPLNSSFSSEPCFTSYAPSFSSAYPALPSLSLSLPCAFSLALSPNGLPWHPLPFPLFLSLLSIT